VEKKMWREISLSKPTKKNHKNIMASAEKVYCTCCQVCDDRKDNKVQLLEQTMQTLLKLVQSLQKEVREMNRELSTLTLAAWNKARLDEQMAPNTDYS